jgi:hypothetical protein
MSENEFDDTCEERDKRTTLFCCICDCEGLDREDEYANKNKYIIVPSCNNSKHSICVECVRKITNLEVNNKNNAGQHFSALKCQYPYDNRGCFGKIKKKHWKALISKHASDRNNSFYVQQNNLYHRYSTKNSMGSLFFIKCSVCKTENTIQGIPEDMWTCKGCFKTSCGRCDNEHCYLFSMCSFKEQWQLPNGYSRYFNETLKNGEIVPLRRQFVTKQMIQTKLNCAKQNAASATVFCPTCKSQIYKTSACNDVKHCGRMHICNYCQQHSFPWEILGLPLEHWTSCKRWDYENSYFPCKENECFSDTNDCNNKEHEHNILRFNQEKFLALESLLKQELQVISL